MAYNILIEDIRVWKKDCASIPRDRLQLVVRKIYALEKDPWANNVQVKQLKEYGIADFRLRVGDYRVLFNKDEDTKTIQLLRLLHRSKLY